VWSGKPPFIILETYKMVEIVDISEFLKTHKVEKSSVIL
tara:strand:- start:55 stop:171 length:117 start_codon:yes stop_codon:yes gene_type:complete